MNTRSLLVRAAKQEFAFRCMRRMTDDTIFPGERFRRMSDAGSRRIVAIQAEFRRPKFLTGRTLIVTGVALSVGKRKMLDFQKKRLVGRPVWVVAVDTTLWQQSQMRWTKFIDLDIMTV